MDTPSYCVALCNPQGGLVGRFLTQSRDGLLALSEQPSPLSWPKAFDVYSTAQRYMAGRVKMMQLSAGGNP
jgi:hypothetical protein